VINKSDRPGARETRRDLELMLDLTDLGEWRPPIVDTVASTGEGVEELWETIGHHRRHQIDHGTLEPARRLRLEREFRQILVARLELELDRLAATARFAEVTEEMAGGALDPYRAADALLADLISDGPAGASGA
jgi:LAO/AO transport system kinase